MGNKFKRYLFVIFVFTLFFVNNLYSQTTYYIDWTNGSDSNDGKSPNTAWKSWYHIQGNTGNTFQPGDSILFKRGEIWKRSDFNALHPGYRDSGEWEPSNFVGSPSNPIVFGAYGTKTGTGMDENRPVIDSDNNVAYIDACYAGYANGVFNYVEFRDIEFTNSVGKTTAGYLVTGYKGDNVHHITFKNCFFDATNMNTTDYTNKNETLSWGADYLTVDSCYAYGEPPYNRHAFYAGGHHVIFTHNYVEGFGLSGLKFNEDGCDYGIMAHNLIINCANGIMIAEARYSDIYSNIVINTLDNGLTGCNPIGLEENYPDNNYIAPRHNKIYNNTFIVNGAMGQCSLVRHRKSGGSYDQWDIYQDNDFKNNIMFLYNSTSDDYMWWLSEGAIYPAPSDYEIYYSDNYTRWINAGGEYYLNYYNLSDWQTSLNAPSGFESYSMLTDPLFINHNVDSKNPDNYKLSQNSPAIDAGTPVTFNNNIMLTDFYGNPVIGNPDMGAIEYQYNITVTVPISDFTVDNTSPDTSEIVIFTDLSTNSPTSWEWTFSPSSISYMDGTSSTSRNPHVKFDSVGTYSVTLIATNSAGSDSETKTNFITASVPVLPPVAAFSVDNKTPTTYQTVVFTDASTNSPTSWEWTFSPSSISYMDGTSSTSRNPHVKFNSAGTYSVTLIATNSAGSDSETKTNFITASVPVLPPVAAFSVDNKTPTTYQTVVFTDASTNSPTSWEWTFSPSSISYMDGTSSTSRNPHVKFNSSSVYSVTLKVTNGGGSDSEIKTNFITATGVKFDIAAFLAGPFENDTMRTDLNSKGFLPKTQPFNKPPWNYAGNESVTGEFPGDVVDWVLIELRTGLDASTRVARQAGVIKNGGLLSRINARGFYFSNIPAGNYYVVVHHRNHLSVMSSVKISLNMDSWALYDFRNSQSKAYGSNSMQDLGNGNYGLYSGDGNSDETVSNADIQDIWIPQFLNSIDGYQAGDFNLDGSVTASDNNVNWLPNNGKKIEFSY